MLINSTRSICLVQIYGIQWVHRWISVDGLTRVRRNPAQHSSFEKHQKSMSLKKSLRGVALGVEFEIGKGGHLRPLAESGHLRPLAATCQKRPLAATCPLRPLAVTCGHLPSAATCGHLRPLALCGHLRSLAATCPLRSLAVTYGHWAGLVGHLLQRPLAATCGNRVALQVTANNEIHCP